MEAIGLHLLPKGIGPKRYLNELFAHTENGVLTMTRPGLYYEYPLVTEYRMNWKARDVPVLYKEYQTLRNALRDIALASAQPKADPDLYDRETDRLFPERGALREEGSLACLLMMDCFQNQQDINEDSYLREVCCKLVEILALDRFCTEKKRIRQEGETWVELKFLERTTFDRLGEEQPCSKLITTGPLGCRVNVFDVGYAPDLKPGDVCAFRLVGHGFSEIKAYSSVEALHADGCELPVPFVRAMSAPVGSSTKDEEVEDANPYPGILMTGKVLAILRGPKEVRDGLLSYTVLVETAEMTFELHINAHAGEIHVGDILCGYVSLDGMVEKV